MRNHNSEDKSVWCDLRTFVNENVSVNETDLSLFDVFHKIRAHIKQQQEKILLNGEGVISLK